MGRMPVDRVAVEWTVWDFCGILWGRIFLLLKKYAVLGKICSCAKERGWRKEVI